MMLESVVRFIFDNIGSELSTKNILFISYLRIENSCSSMILFVTTGVFSILLKFQITKLVCGTY